jgi:voltage-gated potassium channel
MPSDRTPAPTLTGLGRVVAFGLMVRGGVALLGTVSATLASWLIETVAAEKEQVEDLHGIVRRLEAKVDLLTGEREQDPDAGRPEPTGP